MNLQKISVVRRLGMWNVARVVLHRLALRTGWYGKRLPIRPGDPAPPFRIEPPPPDATDTGSRAVIAEADQLRRGRVPLFGTGPYDVGNPPDWFANPVSGRRCTDPARHWSEISDFNSGAGDIKRIWELSRFGWAVILARAFRAAGDKAYLRTLNGWVSDWVARNPTNQGPNWKCGQETSFRMLHLLLAARLLGQHRSPTPALVRFVADHCRRIRPTLHYALAQENNHAVSEAAGLFIGGAWLLTVEPELEPALAGEARKWEETGRGLLEDLVTRLVMHDGSFAQYSVNYHRVLVDILCQIEQWRRELSRPEFSAEYVRRATNAVLWLDAFTDPVSGDAPNVGANDGALLFSVKSSEFRDFRSSVASGLAAFADGCENHGGSHLFPDGGYARLQPPGPEAPRSWAMVRVPRYRFRPSDSDPLHLDLWFEGRNLLRDGGSFSYNPEDPGLREYIAGPAGHNTVQFDGRDPMPLLSRFLRGHWIEATEMSEPEVDDGVTRWHAAYRDHAGAEHRRQVEAGPGLWKITDLIAGFAEHAVLRWRLEPGEWNRDGALCRGRGVSLRIEAPEDCRIRIVEGWESRHYGERKSLPVLEVRVDAKERPVVICTTIELEAPPKTASTSTVGPA